MKNATIQNFERRINAYFDNKAQVEAYSCGADAGQAVYVSEQS